jgi:hypothetical protein
MYPIPNIYSFFLCLGNRIRSKFGRVHWSKYGFMLCMSYNRALISMCHSLPPSHIAAATTGPTTFSLLVTFLNSRAQTRSHVQIISYTLFRGTTVWIHRKIIYVSQLHFHVESSVMGRVEEILCLVPEPFRKFSHCLSYSVNSDIGIIAV